MIIDTHAHLNFNAYNKDLASVISKTLSDDIWMINVGSKYETSKKAVEIAEKYNRGVYAAVGLHPIYSASEFVKVRADKEEGGFAINQEDFDINNYKELALNDKVVAIGEIGLDYYYRPKANNKLELFKNKQKEVFLKQLDLAKELNLPVILHSRMAHNDLIDILDGSLKGVIHCFTGAWDDAEKYLNMGYYLGFNGIIFKLDLNEVIKKAPMDRILVETDCPYLTPYKAKASRNEPLFVKYIIERIAELKGISFKETADMTFENAAKLFKL
ncbi:MAG: TatD family hydrolase [Candidatus Pacebacteria bacterium]|nr:TatD family hydrolase [Candidatus Paceibacterota bacterium]